MLFACSIPFSKSPNGLEPCPTIARLGFVDIDNALATLKAAILIIGISAYISSFIMLSKFGIHSSALLPGPFLVGDPNPKKSAIAPPTSSSPSTKLSQAFSIPFPILSIKFLPQLNASLIISSKKSPILPNRSVIEVHILSKVFFIPLKAFVKNSPILFVTVLKASAIPLPIFTKKSLMALSVGSSHPHIQSPISINPCLTFPNHVQIASHTFDKNPTIVSFIGSKNFIKPSAKPLKNSQKDSPNCFKLSQKSIPACLTYSQA